MIDFNKKMRDDLSVIANPAGVGNITDSSLKDNLSRFRKEIKSFREKNHIKLAAEVKESHPGLANVLYNISVQEDTHQAALHAEVVKLIEAHRKTHGEPPAAMMAVYEILHKRSMDKLAEARRYQDIFK